jgi:5-methylcytosine-specific restriction endonuclease McrA
MIDYSHFGTPKVDWRKAKRKEERQHEKARAICRLNVYNRAFGCCQRCGVPLKLLPSQARHEFEIAHVHEEPARSLGGDPTNPRDCVCLCYKCHPLVQDGKVKIVFRDPVRKAFGPTDFVNAA